MLKLAGLILSCLVLNTLAQNVYPEYYPVYQNRESIVFPDSDDAHIPRGPQTNDDLFTPAPSRVFSGAANVNDIAARRTIPRRPALPQVQQPEPNTSRITTTQPPTTTKSGYNSKLYSVMDIGVNLFKTIVGQSKSNIVFSPYSISSLLALLQQGASGKTQRDLDTVLGMTAAESASTYATITSEFKRRDTRNVLRTAYNVFVGDTFNINSNFKRIARTEFDSDITPLSFSKTAKAVQQINNWVAQKTDGEIESIVTPDIIDVTTQLVLVNAIYFKGFWEIPFNPQASFNSQFYLSDGQAKPTRFMRMKRLMLHGRDSRNDAQVVKLPFENDQYSMMVILPSVEEGLPNTLASLTSERLLSYLSFRELDTHLEIPHFTIRAETDLVEVLQKIGLSSLFGPTSNLEGLGRYGSATAKISSALHSAVLSIDEKGAKAAGVSTFAAVALSYEDPALYFRADRPFIVVIWDTATSLPLFMAKIEDPIQTL